MGNYACTVNSVYCGHCSESPYGSFFQSNVCSLFLQDFAAVRVIGVSVIAE